MADTHKVVLICISFDLDHDPPHFHCIMEADSFSEQDRRDLQRWYQIEMNKWKKEDGIRGFLAKLAAEAMKVSDSFEFDKPGMRWRAKDRNEEWPIDICGHRGRMLATGFSRAEDPRPGDVVVFYSFHAADEDDM